MTTLLKLQDVTLPGSGYPKLDDFIGANLPVKTGLLGLYLLGTSIGVGDPLKNWADNTKPLSVVGAPVVNSFGAAMSKIACFDTGIVSSAAMTFMAVAKPLLAASPSAGALIISNYAGSADPTPGDSIGFSSPSVFKSYAGIAGGVSTAPSISLASADVAAWNFFAGRFTSSGGAQSFYGASGALVASALVDSGDRTLSSRTIRIGGHYDTSFSGVNEGVLFAVFNGNLTDLEIAANYEYLRDVWAHDYGVMTL